MLQKRIAIILIDHLKDVHQKVFICSLKVYLNHSPLAYPHSGYAFSQEEKSNWFLKRQGLAHPQN